MDTNQCHSTGFSDKHWQSLFYIINAYVLIKKRFMKKIFTFLALSTLFFNACNTGGSGDTYTIKMRLNKGDTFNHAMQINMLVNTSGMEMNMKMNTENAFEVMNSAEEKDIKITYRKMYMSMDMGQMKDMNMQDSIINKASSNMVGKSVMIRLSKNNEITDVTGFDVLMNQWQDSASGEMMKNMFSKDQLNSMFGMMFNMYPKKPVKVGESWTGETKVKMANMDMKVDTKYKLLSVKNNLAEIDINGIISATGVIMKQTPGMKMDMSGSQKGTITIRMDNGYLHTGSYKMDMKAEMEMMGQKIPITINGDYTMKGN